MGDTLLRNGSYSSAKEHYKAVISEALDQVFQIPNLSEDGVILPVYGSLPDDKIVVMMECFNGMTECEKKSGNLEEVSIDIGAHAYTTESINLS